MRKLTRRASVLTAGVAVSTAVGVAFAAWTSTGSGTGEAASTHDLASTIAPVTLDVADELYPGATKSTKVTISNPNPYDVVVTSIGAGQSLVANVDCVAGTVRTDGVTDSTGITRSDVASSVIAAGQTGEYELTLRMSDDPHNACKDQTFTLPLTADLKSAANEQSF
jgi:hypothetical protein